MKILKWIGRKWNMFWYTLGEGDGWENGASFVLNKMVKDGYITEEQEFEYIKEFYL